MGAEKFTVNIDADTEAAKSKVDALRTSVEGTPAKLEVSASVKGQKKLDTFAKSLKNLNKATSKPIDIDVKINAKNIKQQIQDAISSGVNAGYKDLGNNKGAGGANNKKKTGELTPEQQAKKNLSDLKKYQKQYEDAAKAGGALTYKDTLTKQEHAQLQSLKQTMNTSRSMVEQLSKNNKVAVSDSVNAITSMDKALAKSGMTTGLATSPGSSELKMYAKQYEDAVKAVSILNNKDNLSTHQNTQMNSLQSTMKQARLQVTELEKAGQISVSESVKAFSQMDKQFDTYITKASKVKSLASEASMDKMSTDLLNQQVKTARLPDKVKTAALRDSLQETQRLYSEIQDQSKALRSGNIASDDIGFNNKFLENQEKYNKSLQKTAELTKQASEAQKAFVDPNKQFNEVSRLDSWLEKNDRVMSSKYGKSLKIMSKQLAQENLPQGEFKELTDQIKQQQTKAVTEGYGGQKFTTQIKNGFKNVATMVTGADIWNGMIQGAKGAVNAVMDVNAAVIDLRKVSDASDTQINKYFDKAAFNAKDLGSSVSDMIQSTAEFSKLGYNLNESEELSRVATLYKNVGDNMDNTQASQSIVSTMRAFDIPAEKAISIVDKFNETGKIICQHHTVMYGEVNDYISQSLGISKTEERLVS